MRAFLDYTMCPASYVEHIICPPESGAEGFFRLGDLRLFGRINAGLTSPICSDTLASIDSFVPCGQGSAVLPFNPSEIIKNLRLEKYVSAVNSEINYISNHNGFSRRLYYTLRPLFPVAFRKVLQRIAIQDWARIPFPAWPVDTTIEDFIGRLWTLVLKTSGKEEIPFIWYWPKDYQSCAIMTHDVETDEGQKFCQTILALEREFGVRSSFELVPEVRYDISEEVVRAIRNAGCEVCIHGLKHDGRLFSSEQVFRKRAKAINQYAEKWGARGFRSPVMYRNQAWYDALNFSFDMSVPNVAHLDPQRGGCCTIFPFFVGDVLELPLTTIQDYPLYHILRSDPMVMWTRQMNAILAKHGLVSFIIHPDYTMEQQKQALYRRLLGLMKRYSEERQMWLALPGEVDTWWRERNSMSLSQQGGAWSVRGKGSHRAAIAYARLENGKLTYVLAKDRMVAV
jgi:hypothetical protein